jgi:hypothetical protein
MVGFGDLFFPYVYPFLTCLECLLKMLFCPKKSTPNTLFRFSRSIYSGLFELEEKSQT